MTTISTESIESALVITSNDGHLNSASAVLKVSATNPEYNQPVLRIKPAGERGGAASIRIDGPSPDIEFVETGPTSTDPGAGKFEIAVQKDVLQINGCDASGCGFETIVVFQQLAAVGKIGFRITSRFEGGLNTAGLVIDSGKVFSKVGLLPSRLASLSFYKRHPERCQRPLNDGEPGIAEWLKICDDIVDTQLFRKFFAEDDCRFLPDDQQLDPIKKVPTWRKEIIYANCNL